MVAHAGMVHQFRIDLEKKISVNGELAQILLALTNNLAVLIILHFWNDFQLRLWLICRYRTGAFSFGLGLIISGLTTKTCKAGVHNTVVANVFDLSAAEEQDSVSLLKLSSLIRLVARVLFTAPPSKTTSFRTLLVHDKINRRSKSLAVARPLSDWH